MKILLIEDDPKTAAFIKRGLTEEGYTVDAESDGLSGEEQAGSGAYDLVILDIMLPGKDGLAILGGLRKKKVVTPVLLLTGKTSTSDKVKGLDLGADDYLVKPFDFEELSARVSALLRRKDIAPESTLCAGGVSMDMLKREVTFKGQPLQLTTKEYSILECFLRRPNIVLIRSALEQRVWNQEFDAGSSNLVDTYVARLRRKIGKEGLIQTVHGSGYRFKTQ